MTNNIIELTPLRSDLTHALMRRGEQILAATDLVGEVKTLAPFEAYYAVREIYGSNGVGPSYPTTISTHLCLLTIAV